MEEKSRALHARRSLALFQIIFNERGKPDEILDPMDLHGKTVYEVFDAFLESIGNSLVELSSTSRYISIKESSHIEQGTLVFVSSGLAGEKGELLDVQSANVRYEFSANDAAMVSSRVLLTTRPQFNYAILCVEHVVHGAGDTTLLKAFKSQTRRIDEDLVMNFCELAEEEAINQFVSVECVEVRKYFDESDIANDIVGDGDYVTTLLKHKRGRPFDIKLLKMIKGDHRKVATLYGLSMKDEMESSLEDSKSTIYVTLKDRYGSQKRFEIDQDFGMPVREILNEEGEPELSPEQFVIKCEERCIRLSGRAGKMRNR